MKQTSCGLLTATILTPLLLHRLNNLQLHPVMSYDHNLPAHTSNIDNSCVSFFLFSQNVTFQGIISGIWKIIGDRMT